jgi:segregation and condensation protein B
MSLKAKLEAVIYAAEEPVTLAQLAVLFAADALEWRAEREAASVQQAAEAADLSQENGEFSYLESESESAESVPMELAGVPVVEQVSEPEPDAALQEIPEASPEVTPALPTGDAAETAPIEAQPAAPQDTAARAEAEERRAARQQDREIRAILRQILDEIIAECAADGRGVEMREIAGGYRMATKPECHDAVRLFVKSLKPTLKLSLPALETLAIIAYKQPITAPEVNEIRGVDSSGVFGSLLARKLIATAGRKQVIGRPILYKTTREFLLRFGLKDVNELPSMEEFEKMAEIELDEPENEAGENAEQRSNPALGPEFDEAASEELEESPSEAVTETESTETTTTAETAVSNEPPPPAEAEPTAPPANE